MTTVNNSIHNWFNAAVAGGSSSAASGIGGTGFSALLAGLGGRGGNSGAGSAASIMDYLARLYPQANFSEGSVGETPADVRDYFGDEEGDNVAIDDAAAEAVAANPALASILESVLNALNETAGATQPAAEGARVQRNIMVTSVSIRFSVGQIDGQTGETLFSNELKTAFSEFSETLRDLALKFFGQTDTEAEAEEGESSENTVVDAATGEEENPFAGFFGAGFSFSMYFSAQWGSSWSAGENGAGNIAVEDFADAFRRQGNFQNYLSSTFSYAMSYGGGLGSGPFTSLLGSGMDIFGMSSQGMWQQGSGFNFRFGASGGGLSGLMAMLASMANSSASSAAPAAPVEGTPEPEPTPEPADIPAEAAAVA